MSKKSYLVTGGAGFIGASLVKALIRKNNSVRVLDNCHRGSIESLDDIISDIEFIEGDIRDKEVVEEAVNGVDVVCHLAYINGTEFFYEVPEFVLDVGVKGIINVLDACKKYNVRELFLASSSEVYQTPTIVPTNETVPLSVPDVLNPRYSYGGGKIISELLAINFGRKCFDRVVIFRPHNVYGPNMGWEHVIPQFVLRMKELVKQNTEDKKIPFPIQGTGSETRAFVFIDDFTDGLIHTISSGEHLEIYNIGTMDEITIEQVAIEVGKYFGREIVVTPGPPARGGTPRRCPNISKLKKLGYSPKVPFNEGLKITALWYEENSYRKPEK